MRTQFGLFSSFQVCPEDDGYGAEAVHFSRETDTVVAHCRISGKINGPRGNGKEACGERGYRVVD